MMLDYMLALRIDPLGAVIALSAALGLQGMRVPQAAGRYGADKRAGVPLLLYHRQPKGMPCRSMRQVREEAKNP